MNKALQLKHLKFGIPILILLFLVALSRTTVFYNAPEELSLGILLDLLITIPLVFFFLIRKTKVPKFTIIYPFIIGVIVAGIIIPSEHQQLLSKIKLIAIPIIEIGMIGMLVFKIRSLNASLKKNKEDDFYDKLLIACNEVFPNLPGKILATEIAVFYYLFAGTRKGASNDLEFTYYKKSGIKTILAVFLFLVVIETLVVHLLVSKWNPALAWVLSFIGVYAILQILAIMRSMDKRLITINQETEILNLRYGFGCQTSIPFQSIAKIEKSRKSITDDKNHVCLSLFDLLDSNNTIIYLNDENTLQKIYGIEKKYKSISLFVDERDLFVERMEEALNE